MFEILKRPSIAIESLQNVRWGGLYVVMLQEPEAFGTDFFAENLGRNKCNLLPENTVYVGKGDNLRKRLRQEFWQTNRATFFRSVGALLGLEPYENQINPTNYMFDGLSKRTIINFIENNMMVSYEFIDCEIERKVKEIELISSCHPLLNIQHNAGFTYSNLETERERCRNIAARVESL